MGYPDLFLAPLSGSIALFIVLTEGYPITTMRNLKDNQTKIVPSRMRGGKELPSSSAFDSPTILNQLVTPSPVDHPDMSMSLMMMPLKLMMILLLHMLKLKMCH